MKTRFYFLAILLSLFSASLAGCDTLKGYLPPQPCKPSVDLPSHKEVRMLPEVDTSNDVLFRQFLNERSEHAKDDSEYNSLYMTCVTGPGK